MNLCKAGKLGIFASVALALGILLVGEGCKKHIPNTFPESNVVAGWQKTSETRAFAAKDLWQYIDGDAEQYIKAGVVSTSTSDYKFQGQLEAVVDVYTMGDAAGARTILESGQSKEAKPVQVGDAGIAFAQSLIFRKGATLVRIVAYESSPTAAQDLLALAHGVEAKL